MTEENNFVNDLDVKTEDFEFDYIKGDDTDFAVEGRDSRTTWITVETVLGCKSRVKGSFRRMTDYSDRIQLVTIKEEIHPEDIVCKLEEADDEVKANEGCINGHIDDFFVDNFGLEQRPRQKARSRHRLYERHTQKCICRFRIRSLLTNWGTPKNQHYPECLVEAKNFYYPTTRKKIYSVAV